MKLCTTCNIEKELIEFSKNKQRSSGYNGRCKCCTNEYYNNNKEKFAITFKNYRIENTEKFKERDKKYYDLNKEKILERKKQYYINKKFKSNQERKIDY